MFTGPTGEVATIEDAYIPSVDDYLLVLHDVSTGQESSYSNGLMSFKDKFILDQIAKLLGITVEYQYWATVHHYSDVLNSNHSALTEVVVYKNDDDEWQYDYEEFRWRFKDDTTETITLDVTVPAGSITLTDNGTYPIPDTVYTEEGGVLHPTGDPIVIPGVDEVVTVRAKSLRFVRKSKDFNYYDGGGRADDTSTLKEVGFMPTGVTVSELEKETVSEVISRILFPESIEMVKVCDTSAYIKFTDEYIDKYCIGGYIRVGAKYPSVDELETVFIPETWQQVAGGSSIGDPIYKSEYVSTDYFINDGQHLGTTPHGEPDPPQTYPVDDDPDSEYNKHLTMYTVGEIMHYCDGVYDYSTWSEVDRSVYYGLVHYKILNDDGTTTDASMYTDNVIGFEDHHTTHPDYVGTDTDFRNSLETGWPFLTNATLVSASTCWSERNEEPGEYIGDSSVQAWVVGVPGEPLYLRWPSDTAPNEHFYIYLPVEYGVEECSGAHDGANDEWSALQGARPDIDPETGEEVIVTLDYSAFGVPGATITHDFKRWIVDKAAVITNVRVVIGKIVDGEGD